VLGIPGFAYADLFSPYGLRRLYDVWLDELQAADAELSGRYLAYRDGAALAPVALSNLLVEVAPHVSRFLKTLFPQAKPRLDEIAAATGEDLHIFRFKDEFVKRRASKRPVPTDKAQLHAVIAAGEALLDREGVSKDGRTDELTLAKAVCQLLDRETELKKRGPEDPELVALRSDLDAIGDWVMARKDELLHEHHFLSLHFPHHLDPQHLVPLRRPDGSLPELFVGHEHKLRHRDGFKLTDRRMSPREVLDQVDYCMYCHDRDKDSCSKGMRDKQGAVKQNAIGVAAGRLAGRARAHHRRQPHVPGHRPPHLQRLHEGLHLPEAGAGEHSADRDRVAHRRADAALRRRDLRAPHPLEPAQRAAAVSAAV
jgi:hypothetical protein